MKYLGIDVGSLYISLVLLDEQGAPGGRCYRRHHGEPARALIEALPELTADGPLRIARTGSGAAALPLPGRYVDAVIAGLEGARAQVPGVRNVLSIGGGSFSLVELSDTGEYRCSKMNSACASGTGAFLDQQALRLQMDPEELPRRAARYQGTPPGVATRCAVFAKSDMIHLQQEGYTADAIAAGLCRGLGFSTVDGLLGGRRMEGKTVLIGGVARNRVVADAVREKLGTEIEPIEAPEHAGALGAALMARKEDGATDPVTTGELITSLRTGRSPDAEADKQRFLRAPLTLERSTYPDFSWNDRWVDEDGNETAIVSAHSGTLDVVLGLDIGSTSTKAVVLDPRDQVIGWVYRRTAGDPIRAVQRLFDALRRMQRRGGFTLAIHGVGVTGSGRKLIGRVVGADLVLNEITAHARAALFLDPEVDTIIELGGQDAKFTQLQNGMVYNSVMNYVCAAGTGSFIEEQAQKLGIPLDSYAEVAMAQEAPPTSDRCTVYMERDLDLLLARGWDKARVAAAVLHSVRDNYLNKVVGGLHIGEHIYFQGATARNRALVAAFEAGLQKPVRVSRFCHLTGSLGMALLVRERIPAGTGARAFKGLDFADHTVHIEQETCELCRNTCRLSVIHSGGETVAWGLKCGRDYADRRARSGDPPEVAFWRRREQAWRGTAHPGRPPARLRVGLPRSLGTYNTYPFWRTLLEQLGCDVVFASRSSEACLRRGTEIATAECCAPVLMSHGHVLDLLKEKNVDFLLAPHLIDTTPPPGFPRSYFCVYVQSHPAVLKSLRGLPETQRILAPIFSFAASREEQFERLQTALARPLGADAGALRSALDAAHSAQQTYDAAALAIGREALQQVEQADGMGLVCIGRPYNTTDPGLTLDLPRKIAAMGYPVISLDMLPLDFQCLHPQHTQMYWHYGQRILAAAEAIVRRPQWFGIYFTHFMCGPDSYLLTYFKDIMARAGKPYLCLQLDGHGADAGYLTRVEAALETFHAWSNKPPPGTAAAPAAGTRSRE